MKTARYCGLLMLVAVYELVLAASPEQKLERLAMAMTGYWDSHLGPTQLPLERRFSDRRVRINAPALGKYVFYQQLNQRESLELYRQRILVLETGTQGQLVQRSYALANPHQYVDGAPSNFNHLQAGDLKPPVADGCETYWQETANGFTGRVDPGRCIVMSLRTGRPRGIESINILQGDTLQLVERGFDEQGQQVFGTPKGETLTLFRAR